MNTAGDRFNDYINSHPRESLCIVLIILSLVWQSVVGLLALLAYVLSQRYMKSQRWILLPAGAFLALMAFLIQRSHPSFPNFIRHGFSLNGEFWLLIYKQQVLGALVFMLRFELPYVLGFPLFIAGLFNVIDLISGSPHAKTMQALQKGIHPELAVEKDDKEITKALSNLKDDQYDGTVLGVSKYSGQYVLLPDRDINQVALVLGTTGAGKTITLRRFYQRAIKKGYPLIIVDGKPDDANIAWVKQMAERSGRPFFGFNCDDNRHYDPLANGGFTELKDKIVCLKDEWSSDYYRSIAEAYLQTTFQVLIKVFGTTTLNQVMDCLVYKNLVTLANSSQDENLMKRVQLLKNYEMKDITGLQAHMDILINSELGYFFDKNESSFSLLDVISQSGVVYFALPALKFPSFSKVLGKLVINDIKAVVERHKNNRELFTVFDEFSVFAGEQVLNLVNMGRGKGVHAIFGTQGLADLARVDDGFKSQVLNCVNTIICHRLNDQESAEAVAGWIGTRNTFTVTAQLNAAESGAGMGTVRQNREFIVHPDAIKQELRVGEAFYASKVGGFRWEKVRVIM